MGLLSLISSHPLANKQERGRLLRRLANDDALTALKEATDWLRTLSDAQGMSFALRSTLISQLDNAAQRPARVLGRVYLTTPQLSEQQAMSLWRASRAFWTQLGAAYSACLADFARSAARPHAHRVSLTRMTVRLMQAYAMRLQWSQYCYWPVSDVFWESIGRAYLYALDNDYLRRSIGAHPADLEQTTVEREYLRMLVFHISATDGLLPLEIEIAGRLIARLSEWFQISSVPQAGYPYVVDPEQRSPPSRIVRSLEARLSHMYFSPVAALGPLQRLQERLEHGELPQDMDLGRYRSPHMVMPVIRHLAACWAEPPRNREHGRYKANMSVTAVAGLNTIRRCLIWPALAQRVTKRWLIKDVSLGGFRARVPVEPDKQLRIGTLLGIQAEGGHGWLIAVVRRASRESETQGLAGVEVLSKDPIAVSAELDGPVDALLLDPPEEGVAVRLIVREVSKAWDRPMRCAVLGTTFGLAMVETLERGADFSLVRCRVVEHS